MNDDYVDLQQRLKAEQKENARLRQVARWAVSQIMQWEGRMKAWEQGTGPDAIDEAPAVLRDVKDILVGDKEIPTKPHEQAK